MHELKSQIKDQKQSKRMCHCGACSSVFYSTLFCSILLYTILLYSILSVGFYKTVTVVSNVYIIHTLFGNWKR